VQISTISTSIGGESHCHFPHFPTPMICLIRILSPTGPNDPAVRIWLRGDQSIRVGRQTGIDLLISDPHMSRYHFVIEGFESGFRLRDLDSRNGTRLNGVKVAVATLQSGDSIRAGATTLGVEFCVDRYDTIGPEPPTRHKVGSMESPGVLSEPGPETQHIAGSDRVRGVERSKASDDETQWMVDSTVSNSATEISPVIAAMGVDHVGSDSVFGEIGLFASFNGTDAEGLTLTSHRPANHDEPIAIVPDGVRVDHASQAVLASVETSPVSTHASPGDTEVPEGLEDFGLQCLPDVGTGRGFVLRQAGSRGIDLCEHLGQFYRLLLVVNRSQLDPTCASLLDYLVEQGSASAVTQTIYRIDGDNSRVPLLQLIRRASRRDAAVCLGFRYTDSDPPAIIADISHLLCYPSLLFSHLNRREQDASPVNSLFKKVVFFLFEKDLSGDVYLFAERGFRPAGTLAK